MMLTIDEIKESLRAIKPSADAVDIIAKGELTSCDGEAFDYTIHCGEDISKCLACDDLWPQFNIELFQFIDSQNLDAEALENALNGIQVDDSHWKWFNKAIYHNGGSYFWFFLMADGKPQCASLVYHPKKSAFEDVKIYYIEYIAVAPWNRVNPMKQQFFKGLGSLMIKSIITHARDKLSFNNGFSLHALSRAEEFYKKIGMLEHAPFDKDGLLYFEMPPERIELFLEGK